MAGFSNWVRNKATAARGFLNKAGAHARTSVHFLNHKVIPGVRTLHKKITDVSNELQKDSYVSEKNRERLKNFSKLSDIGLKRLEDTTQTVNRVTAVV